MRNSGLLFQEEEDWVTLRPGSNCSQEEVNMNLLRYVHMEADDAKIQDFFVFLLSDGKNQSPSQHFHISIKELEMGTGPQHMFFCMTLLLTFDVIFREHRHLCEASEGQPWGSCDTHHRRAAGHGRR